MHPNKPVENAVSVLLTSNEWKQREKAVSKLIESGDDRHFKEIRNIYLNESYSQVKRELISLISENYLDKGTDFLKRQYKKEKDWKVRNKIVKTIISSKNQDILSFLLNALKDSSKEIKKIIIEELGEKKYPEAIKSLLDLLQYGNDELVEDVNIALIKIGRAGNIQQIINNSSESNVYVKKSVAFILSKLADKKAKPLLIKYLQENNFEVRINTINALSKILDDTDDKVIKELINMLNISNNDLKVAIIDFLYRINPPKLETLLIKQLKEKNKEIRKKIRNILIEILQQSQIFDNIYKVLRGRNINARIEAIKILGELRVKKAINLLIKNLNSRNAKIRRSAYKSLLKISNNKIDKKLIDALSSNKWQIRKWIAKVMGKIKDDQSINLLFNLLKDPKSNVRYAAMRSLTKFDKKKIIKGARPFIKDKDWKFRRALVRLFKRIEDPEVNEILIEFLKDKDIQIKSWAAKALGEKNVKESIPYLHLLLNDPNPKVILASIKSLGLIKDKNSINSLIPLINHQNWEIKNEVNNTLNEIDPDWFDSI